MRDCSERFVFAGTPYSNCAPLVDQLTTFHQGVKLILDYPANLVSDLVSGRFDVALLPVAHLFAHSELEMIPGLGVAANGAVKSVLLKCKVPLSNVHAVGLDPASGTSNLLATFLLKERYKLDVEMFNEPYSLVDASVVIGDRALLSNPAPSGDIDLAAAWKEVTGLPFVFAVWAVRKDHPKKKQLIEIAHAAYQAGLEHIEFIIQRYAVELGRDPAFWSDYLTNCICYELGEIEMTGLHRFQQLIETQITNNS